MVTNHLKANLHFARLDRMEKGPVEFQALAAVLCPLAQVAPLSSALDVASPDPLGWAHRLSLPPSFGLMK